MSERDRKYYLAFRRHYEPQDITLVVIAESPPIHKPPAKRRYFYDPNGAISEPLFAAMMRCLGVSPATKEEGLREFQQKGWVLLDATYEPVNALGPRARDEVIVRDYNLLRRDLERLLPNRGTPVALIKSNVYRMLKPKLEKDGFYVINGSRVVPFPSHGWQKKFHKQLSSILRSADLLAGA